MIIIRQKQFGKLDRQLAAQQGISVEQLRQNRQRYNGAAGVHSAINRRAEAAKEGGSAAVKRVNSNRLFDYKDELADTSSKKEAYKFANEGSRSSLELRGNKQADRKYDSQYQAKMNNSKHTANQTKNLAKKNPKTAAAIGPAGALDVPRKENTIPQFGKEATEGAMKHAKESAGTTAKRELANRVPSVNVVPSQSTAATVTNPNLMAKGKAYGKKLAGNIGGAARLAVPVLAVGGAGLLIGKGLGKKKDQ